MKINRNAIHQFFNPLFCDPAPAKKSKMVMISVLFGIATAGIPHAIYFVGKGINAWSKKDSKLEKNFFQKKVNPSNLKAQRTFWDTRIKKEGTTSFAQKDIEPIIDAIANSNTKLECPYDEIYFVFNFVHESNLVFGDDGPWSSKTKHVLSLSENEKSKVLVIFIPLDEACSTRLNHNAGEYLEILPVCQPILKGFKLKAITYSDYQQIVEKKKITKNVQTVLST